MPKDQGPRLDEDFEMSDATEQNVRFESKLEREVSVVGLPNARPVVERFFQNSDLRLLTYFQKSKP